MTNRLFSVLLVLLYSFIFCRSQLLNYQCNFNDALTGDCQFTKSAGAPNLMLDAGPNVDGVAKQPYSDVCATLSPTILNNELCKLPYVYPSQSWQMYFCRRVVNGSYTCPTVSGGAGQCVVGKYGLVKSPTSGTADYTYTATVQQSSSISQCLDFYYYITDTTENAKIEVSWEKDDEEIDSIVDLTATSENKWQHRRIDFTGPSSPSSYKIVFRMKRDRNTFVAFYFALDEIKIYDGSCDALPPTTTPIPATTTVPVQPVSTTTIAMVPVTTTTVRSQLVNYQCNFNDALTGDCQFTKSAGAPNLMLDAGPNVDGVAKQPYSDVCATLSPTILNNELCQLPYVYPSQSWQMYFCRRVTGSSYTCPTVSGGAGQCVVGKYGLVKSVTSGPMDHRYTATVQQSPSTSQCLDFYYYITDTTENAKIEVSWETDEDLYTIVDVTAMSENKWQHRRIDFTGPSSPSSYKIVFRMKRDRNTFFAFNFALDEIKIYDASCDALPPKTTPIPATTTVPVTSVTTTTTSTTTTITTTEPLISLFSCDFSIGSCFEDAELIVTNGTQFTPIDITEPPRAPLSDVNSIIEPTSNKEKCTVPYQLSVDNTTSAEMWFCYQNQCPTQNSQSAACISGSYGLISIQPWESNKTITTSVSPNIMMRDLAEDHCLAYYYYMTVYDGNDWGQQLSVSIRSADGIENEVKIDRLSVAAMIDNRWHSRNVTFSATSRNYTLVFSVQVANANRTIYFALDNINILNKDCFYMPEPYITSTMIPSSTTSIIILSSTASTVGGTLQPTKLSANWGLILGLSIGFGILVLLLIIGGVLYHQRGSRHSRFNVYREDRANIPMKPKGGKSDDDDFTRYIY